MLSERLQTSTKIYIAGFGNKLIKGRKVAILKISWVLVSWKWIGVLYMDSIDLPAASSSELGRKKWSLFHHLPKRPDRSVRTVRWRIRVWRKEVNGRPFFFFDSRCCVSRLKGLGVVGTATATLAGQGDGADNHGAGFVQVQERHRVSWGHLAARLLQAQRHAHQLMSKLRLKRHGGQYRGYLHSHTKIIPISLFFYSVQIQTASLE